MCYVDQKDESFYTLSWACSIDGIPFLVAGGINGIIRVIDTGNEKIQKVFLSGGCSIWFTLLARCINSMLFPGGIQVAFTLHFRDVYTFYVEDS